MKNRGNSLVWIAALLMSALAWGEPKHIAPVSPEDFRKAVEQVQAPEGTRPAGPSKASALVSLLKAMDDKGTDVRIEALDVGDLLNAYVAEARVLRRQLSEYGEESTRISGLNKKVLDPEADAALKLERELLETKIVALRAKLNLNPDKVDSPAMKAELVEALLRFNRDRVLLAYGRKLLEVSEDPKYRDLDAAAARVKALENLQQAEAKNPELVKALVTQTGGVDIYPASHRTRIELDALAGIFAVKEGQFDSDTLRLAQEILLTGT